MNGEDIGQGIYSINDFTINQTSKTESFPTIFNKF